MENKTPITAHEQNIENIFSQSDKFIVPPYQRDYTWSKKEEFKVLIDDIERFIEEKGSSYYLGNYIIKSKTTPTDGTYFELIDGQQRLTSCTILRKAILTAAKVKKIIDEEFFVNKVKNEFYISNGRSSSNSLKFSKMKDEKSLEEILNHKTDTKIVNDNDSNIIENYNYAVKRLSSIFKDEEMYDKWEGIFKNIYLVRVLLTQEDKAEQVFENINSKGKDLSVLDLIRNKIYLKLIDTQISIPNREEITRLVEKTFDQLIDQYTSTMKDSEILDFIRQGIMMITGSYVEKKNAKVYSAFNSYISKEIKEKSSREDFEKIINNFSTFTKVHKFIKNTPKLIKNNMLSFRFSQIYSSGNTANLPLLSLIIQKSKQEIEFIDKIEFSENLIKYFEVIEKYVIRRSILNLNSGINLMMHMYKIYNSMINSNITPEILKEELKAYSYTEENNSDTSDIKFPTRKEVEDKFNSIPIYTQSKEIAKYILLRYESSLSKEEFNPNTFKNLTVEHIIPQTIDPSTERGMEWIAALGKEPYMQKIDTFGNLSLASKSLNSAMSNRPFNEKAELFNGSGTRLIINTKITDYAIKNDENSKEIFNIGSVTSREKDLLEYIKEWI